MTTSLGHVEELLALPVRRGETTERIVIHRHPLRAADEANHVSDAAAPGTVCIFREEPHA
jgi:hypothetical protein